MGAIIWVYAEIVRRIARHERVCLLVQNARAEATARDTLSRSGVDMAQVDLVPIATDRAWMRDTAPSFIKRDDEIAVVDWQFNGWAKYPNHQRDNRVPSRIAALRGLQKFRPTRPHEPLAGIVLEGGSIDLDGQGTLLTTEECLLSEVQQRNPGMTRAEIEAALADNLGVEKVLWLDRGIAGDDTHGHVDDLARFVKPGQVVIAAEQNESDENYVPLRENMERLRGMVDAQGRGLEVVPLPMPLPIVFDGLRLPASYANFYIANELVLVPTFNDVNDRQALGILGELFKGREVVGIHAVDLVWGLGTLHCMSHEEPL